MKILILGAGNLLLSDEGFGVHFIRHLEAHYVFPDNVKLLDAGTAGILLTHELEEADRVYIVDVVAAKGPAGRIFRYEKNDFMLNRIPVKMSPHQIGIQEMLLVSELRGKCPKKVSLLGIIPQSLAPGSKLSTTLQSRISQMAESLVTEIAQTRAELLMASVTEAAPTGHPVEAAASGFAAKADLLVPPNVALALA